MQNQITVENLEVLALALEGAETITATPIKSKAQSMSWDNELNTIIASADITAKYFGVTKQTLSNWVKNGCPRVKYGFYDIKAVSEWRIEASGIGAAPENDKDLETMSLKNQKVYFEKQLKAAQADAAQMRAAIMKGDYLERKIAVDDLKSWAVVLKRSLLGLGRAISRDVASALSPAEARRFDKQITDTINDALDQLSTEGCYHEIR